MVAETRPATTLLADVSKAMAEARHLSAFDLTSLPRGCHRPWPMPHRCGMSDQKLEKLLDKLMDLLEAISEKLDDKPGCNGPRPMPPITTMPVEPEPVPEMDPIAGKGRIWGDPHFIGADGGKYDVQGVAGQTYNLLSDKGFQMNGRFDDWGGQGATVVGEVGILAGTDKITVKKDGSVFVNGQEVKDGESVRLANGGCVHKKGDNISVKSGEWEVNFQAKDSSRGDYLNMDVITENAVSDGVKPHGLLGQTFDGDGEARNGDKGKGAQGGGAIEHVNGQITDAGNKLTVGTYAVDDIHAIPVLHNRFGEAGDVQPSPPELGDMVTNAFETLFESLMTSLIGSLTQSLQGGGADVSVDVDIDVNVNINRHQIQYHVA